MTTDFIKVENAEMVFETKKGRFHALREINLSIAQGEFVTLIGHSGCGKSTLLNLIAGLLKPTSGVLLCDRREIDAPGPERAVVFQNHSLLPWLSCAENVHLAVERVFGARETGAQLKERTQAALELVGMGHAMTKRPHEISGGMQQRVGIARALANDPQILLMDEPFGALDAQTRELLQEEIKRIWQDTRKTVLWITHSIEEALFLATDIVVMTARPGRIKARLRPQFALSRDPAVVASAEFVRMKAEIFGMLREEALAAQEQEAAR